MEEHLEDDRVVVEEASSLAIERTTAIVNRPDYQDAAAETWAALGGTSHSLPIRDVGGGAGADGGEEMMPVAVAVDESVEHHRLPTAFAADTENDDDDGWRRRRRHERARRYLFASVAAVCLLVAAAVAIAVVFAGAGDDDDDLANEEERKELLRLRREIVWEHFPEAEMEANVTNSPYAKALRWITFDDPWRLDPEDENFLRRYGLTYLYYATTKDGPWNRCNPPDEERGESSSCVILQLGGDSPIILVHAASFRWLSEANDCDWAGVRCDDRRTFVRSLDLSYSEMSGTFPGGLLRFEHLEELNFAMNNLTGTLPPTLLKNGTDLVRVDLSWNKFDGEIPPLWWESGTVQELDLERNSLVGSIPSAVSSMKSVVRLHVGHNLMEGTIPTQFAELTTINRVFLSGNLFSGSIRPLLVPSMDTLLLRRNFFSGSLPKEVGTASNLFRFDLNRNLFSGTLPDEFYDLGSAAEIFLYENNFTGDLDSRVSRLSDLVSFDVRKNSFGGAIPPELALLSDIRALHLSGNDFTGSVPPSLCALSNPDLVRYLEADCLPTELQEGGLILDPEVYCPPGCCTRCCDRNDVCVEN